MNARDRLAAVLAPDVLDALDDLVAEHVSTELARLGAKHDNGPRWRTVEQAAGISHAT